MSNKFPVKYAVEPLEIYNGYQSETKGYIVSKCYLLENRISFNEETKFHEQYVVCFPYDSFSTFYSWYQDNFGKDISKCTPYSELRRDPKEDSNEDMPNYPRHVVDRVFDDYDAAESYAQRLYTLSLSKRLYNRLDPGIEMIQRLLADKKICKAYKMFIDAKTKDMVVPQAVPYYDSDEEIANMIERFSYNPSIQEEVLQKYKSKLEEKK